jgi:hypothetical protein
VTAPPVEAGNLMTARGFPLPWSVAELEGCFVVTDSTQQKLAYIYFENDPGRRSATKSLSRHEALRVAGQLCGTAGFGGRDWFGF